MTEKSADNADAQCARRDEIVRLGRSGARFRFEDAWGGADGAVVRPIAEDPDRHDCALCVVESKWGNPSSPWLVIGAEISITEARLKLDTVDRTNTVHALGEVDDDGHHDPYFRRYRFVCRCGRAGTWQPSTTAARGEHAVHRHETEVAR